MAKLSETTIKDIAEGVLIPHLTHRFLVHIGHASEEIRDQVSRQVISIKLDYKNKTINLVIAQPFHGGALHQFLDHWVTQRTNLKVIATSGTGEPTYIIRFNQLECLSHEFELDYAECKQACHLLEFKYGAMTMGDPEQKTVSFKE